MRRGLIFAICCLETAIVLLVVTSRAAWTDTAADILVVCCVVCWAAYCGLVLRSLVRRGRRGERA